jgi:fatty-acyl-CoA synthase
VKATSAWSETHARFRPHAEAIFDVERDRRLTWAEVHAEVQRWTAFLQRRGVRAGDRVAVLSHNRAETLLLLLACAELEAVLFPMNWRLSAEELSWQLGHSEPRVLLVDEAFRDAVRHERVHLDDGPGEPRASGPGSRLEAPWQLMYTSGSTGRPKGALLTHQQLHWNALNTILACDLQPADATLTFTPLFHTGGMNSLTTPLLHRGGRVVLTKGVDAGQALRLIPAERVTLLMGVPTIFQMLAEHPAFSDADLGSVRDALCGGQALPLPLLERYLARRIPLRQGFGMTEVGPNCFSMPHDRVKDKLGTVGLPIHHVATKLVRPDGSEAAVDEPGEMLLRGPAVFGGYFRDPDATAKALDADGWFHTGDVLSADAEGFHTVRGRIKEMYKSGGENVYPAEVEVVLQEHPAVALAAVLGVPDERWGEVGLGFVELRPGHALDPADLSAWLQGRLARFKQPKRVIVSAQLPRTASGKIDKVALRTLV